MTQDPTKWPKLMTDFNWLLSCLEQRLQAHFDGEECHFPVPPAPLTIASFLEQELGRAATSDECLFFLLALCPHYRPDLLDGLFNLKLAERGDFPLLGGRRGKEFRGFLPTGETILFLLAGTDTTIRAQVYAMMTSAHPFVRKGIIQLGASLAGEPRTSALLLVDDRMLERVLFHIETLPSFGIQFPAKQLKTKMEWSDLVLDSSTYSGVQEILHWLHYGDEMEADSVLGKRIKPGYRALFFGPPGTGKTLTATLLGKRIQQPVFRVDLSMVVSKYIGETEKNLSLLFNQAENKNWILFFDEADALFGKRTNVKDSHDRYANQEVSYLLQRVEDYNGLVILASNLKGNIDKAFARRFQSIIHFPMPNAHQRFRLWEQAISPSVPMDSSVDLRALARQYELSGASIVNVQQYAHLMCLAEKRTHISEQLIKIGVQREFRKLGKVN